MSYPAPNYTQIPNILLEDHIKSMSEAEIRVALAIARKTFGWHKRQDKLSLSQLEELTGMSRQGVINGIGAGLTRGIIARIPDGNSYLYELTVSSELLVNEVDQNKIASQPSRPVLVNEVDQLLVNEVDTQKKHIKKLLKERGDLDHSSNSLNDDAAAAAAFALSVKEDRVIGNSQCRDHARDATRIAAHRWGKRAFPDGGFNGLPGYIDALPVGQLVIFCEWCHYANIKADNGDTDIADFARFVRGMTANGDRPSFTPAEEQQFNDRMTAYENQLESDVWDELPESEEP